MRRRRSPTRGRPDQRSEESSPTFQSLIPHPRSSYRTRRKWLQRKPIQCPHDRALPLVFEMGQPGGRLDQERTRGCIGPGQPNSVGGAQVLDALASASVHGSDRFSTGTLVPDGPGNLAPIGTRLPWWTEGGRCTVPSEREERHAEPRLRLPFSPGDVGEGQLEARGGHRGKDAGLHPALPAGVPRRPEGDSLSEPRGEADAQPDPGVHLPVPLRPGGGVHRAVGGRPRAPRRPRERATSGGRSFTLPRRRRSTSSSSSGSGSSSSRGLALPVG